MILDVTDRAWSSGESLGWQLAELGFVGPTGVRAAFVHRASGKRFGVEVCARDAARPAFRRLELTQVTYAGELDQNDPAFAWKAAMLGLLARKIEALVARAPAAPWPVALGRSAPARPRVFGAEAVLALLAPHFAIGDVLAGFRFAGASEPHRGEVELAFEGPARVVFTLAEGRPTPLLRGAAVEGAVAALAALVGFAVELQLHEGVAWASDDRAPAAATFCVLPWTMLHVSTDGTAAPCCLFTRPLAAADGRPLDVRRDSLADAWSSADLADVRARLGRGEQVDACERCWRVERGGGFSRRQHFLREFADHLPRARAGQPRLVSLALNPGNLCNLRCRTCDPGSSSAWIAEARDVDARVAAATGGTSLPVAPKALTNWLEDNDVFAREIDALLAELEIVEVLGGEPLYIAAHFDLLERAVRGGHARHIELRYDTNGTVVPARGLELWPHFARVRLQVSLDAVGPRFEYLRYPAKWDAVVANIARLRDLAGPIEVCSNATFSLLSAYYLPELFAWARGAGLPCTLNPLGQPPYLDARALPAAAKRAVRERLEACDLGAHTRASVRGLLELMDADDWSARELPAFRLRTRLHDEYRGQSFAAAFPELASLLAEA